MSLAVFLVEDDPRLQVALSEALTGTCDAEMVGVAETQSNALRWLSSHPKKWQLAVLDLFLRTGTGFGVLEGLPAAMRRRVIVLTNSATPENRNRCLSLGALAVYDKTSELHQFLEHCQCHGTTHAIGDRKPM